jgi:hypothetical protein
MNMAHVEDSDAHATEVQLDMFGAPPSPSDAVGSDLRAEIADVLGKVRASPSEPWEAGDVEHLRNIFGRMAERLPTAEAAQLRRELDAELARLTAALTAAA